MKKNTNITLIGQESEPIGFFVSFFANHHQRVTSNLCVPIRQNINPSTKTLTSYITRPAPRVNLFFESLPHRYASLFRRRTFAENAFSPKKIMPPIPPRLSVRSRTTHMPRINLGISSVRPALFTYRQQKPGESSPMPRRASASDVLWLRSEHASGNSADASFPSASSSLASIPPKKITESHKLSIARRSVVSSLRLAPDLRLTPRVVLTACALRLMPQYTRHSNLLRFPKFIRSPSL